MTKKDEVPLDYGVIDDFLPQKEFEEIKLTIMNDTKVQWAYTPNITGVDTKEGGWKHFYMCNTIYKRGIIRSPLYNELIPVFNQLEIKALIRIKMNLYPNTEKIHEHEQHIDYPYSHKAGILYINTCDGYTKLADGTKIDSVANRMLLFDASTPHCSTTTSDTTARFNINFNYF